MGELSETVKSALLLERAAWLEAVRESEAAISRDETRAQMRRLDMEHQRNKVADVEAHLREHGVDLAAVDRQDAIRSLPADARHWVA